MSGVRPASVGLGLGLGLVLAVSCSLNPGPDLPRGDSNFGSGGSRSEAGTSGAVNQPGAGGTGTGGTGMGMGGTVPSVDMDAGSEAAGGTPADPSAGEGGQAGDPG